MKSFFTLIFDSNVDRIAKAKRIADTICRIGHYSWVGLYDVTCDTITMIGCTGNTPAYPSFPRDKGLNGRAVKNKTAVVVNDVQKDPDYLTTFTKTASEVIIPIILSESNEVVGTIDVESDQTNSFQSLDLDLLLCCAEQIKPLWHI